MEGYTMQSQDLAAVRRVFSLDSSVAALHQRRRMKGMQGCNMVVSPPRDQNTAVSETVWSGWSS